jgi:DNA adenine methylase
MTGICTRPLLRYHGGKWLLAPWIIAHFPQHQVYTETFGGAASVLMRKDRAYAEIYNDLDDTIVDVFRLLRDTTAAAELIRRLELTLFSRSEFVTAYEPTDDPIEKVRRTIIRSFQGFGTDGTAGQYRTGFRANSNRSGSTPAADWRNYPPALSAIVERLAGVVIEQRPAIDVMRAHDGVKTLHYVDPPYMPETRSAGSNRKGAGYHVYSHEMSAEDHNPLLDALCELRGMVVLSGYPTPTYDERLAEWKRVERPALADGARPRTEVLWLNPACVQALGHGPLFSW